MEDRRDDGEELLPVVDREGNTIGCAARRECHDGSMRLHPVVHLHVVDSQGRVYLQLRPEWKEVQPGKWDTAVGGHVAYGENIHDALRREVLEEVGLSEFEPVLLRRYLFESPIESELVYMFATVTDDSPLPSAELAGGRFWTLGEIAEAAGTGKLTPNFESELRVLKGYVRAVIG